MMHLQKPVFCLLILWIVTGCGQGNDNVDNDYMNQKEEKEADAYADEDYCATIDYSNPNTGTESVYTLIVTVQDNEVTEIHWPSGGVLDSDHFDPTKLDSDGRAQFVDDRGNSYEIEIKGKSSGCFDGLAGVHQCKGKTRTGRRCKNMTDNENGYCNKHRSQAE